MKRGNPLKSRCQRRRNCRSALTSGKALVAAAAIAGGTQSYGVPVRFDNPPGPGHYDWAGAMGSSHPLDIRKPADQQGVASGASSEITQKSLQSAPGYVTSSLEMPPFAALVQLATPGGIYGYRYLHAVAANASIPVGGAYADTFGRLPMIYRHWGSSLVAYLPTGTPSYLGVKFNRFVGYGGHVHFGWLKVQRTGRALDVLAWGYETAEYTPIPVGSGSPPGDMSGDGTIDAADVPAFLNALTGVPLPPGTANRSDMNGDGTTDGRDIQPFVNAVLQ